MFDENNLMERIFNAPSDSPLQIYKNNILSARVSALTDLYEQTVAFLGKEFFKMAAQKYAEQHHGLESNLNLYGKDFGHFLSTLPQCANFPYLRDLTAFEYEMRCLFYAPSEGYLTMDDIAAGAEIRHIQKATYMMISEYDILSLSDFISGTEKQPNLEKGLYYILLYRCPKTLTTFAVPATKEQAEIFPGLYTKGMETLTDEMMQNQNIAEFVTFFMHKHLLSK